MEEILICVSKILTYILFVIGLVKGKYDICILSLLILTKYDIDELLEVKNENSK